MSNRIRIGVFVAICVAAVVLPALYFLGGSKSSAQVAAVDSGTLAGALAVPHAVVLDESKTLRHGDVSIVSLAHPGSSRVVVPLRCDRIAVTAGHGICLQTQTGFGVFAKALILDANFHVVHSVGLPGPPSRARVSPNGKYAAYTVFVAGDSYASAGFSTRSGIIDVDTGAQVLQLEQMKITRNGSPFHRVDFNFWGVTFASDNDHFYATLGTAGHHYLVYGSVSSRAARVLTDGVECPSLSPDGTRIAYKHRVKGGPQGAWRPAILDLKTMQKRVLPETRNVDDQISWLDDDHILYDIPVGSTPVVNVWSLRADGTGRPVLYLPNAASPTVSA